MKAKLFLKEKNVTLVLMRSDSVVSEKSWVDENNLLEIFFPMLDEMLKGEKINITDVDDFLLETEIPQGYTTARIARTIVKTLNFACKS